jgi:hypothetical protein
MVCVTPQDLCATPLINVIIIMVTVAAFVAVFVSIITYLSLPSPRQAPKQATHVFPGQFSPTKKLLKHPRQSPNKKTKTKKN